MYEIEKLRIEAPDLPLQYLKETFPELRVAFFKKALDGMARDYVIRSLYGVHGKKKPKKAKDRKPEVRRKLEYERFAPSLKKIKTQVEQLRGRELPPPEFVAQFKELALVLTRDFFECCVQPSIDAKLKALRTSLAKPLNIDSHAPLTTTILGQYFGSFGRDVPVSWMIDDYNLAQIDDHFIYHNRDMNLEHALLLFSSSLNEEFDEQSSIDFVAVKLIQLLAQRGLNRTDCNTLLERYILPRASEPVAQKLRAARDLAFRDEDFSGALHTMLTQGQPRNWGRDRKEGKKTEPVFWSERPIGMINLIMHPFVQYDLQGLLHAGFAYMVVGFDVSTERCYPLLTLVKLLGAQSIEQPIVVPAPKEAQGGSCEDVITQVVAHLRTVLTDAQERAQSGANALELPSSQLSDHEFNQELLQGAQVIKQLYERRQGYATSGVNYSTLSELEILDASLGLNFEHLLDAKVLAQAQANAGDACFVPDVNTEEGRALAPACIYFHPYYKLLFEQMTEEAFQLLPQYLNLNSLAYVVVHSLTAEVRHLCAKYLPFTLVLPQCLSELSLLMNFYPESLFSTEYNFAKFTPHVGMVYKHWLEDTDTFDKQGLNLFLENLIDDQIAPSLGQYLKQRIKARFDPLALAGDCSLYTLASPFELMTDTRNWLDNIMHPELSDPQYAANALTYLGNLMPETMGSFSLHKMAPALSEASAAVARAAVELNSLRLRLGQTQQQLKDSAQFKGADLKVEPKLLGAFDQSFSTPNERAQLIAEYQLWQDSFQLCLYDELNSDESLAIDELIARIEKFKADLESGKLKRELPDFNVVRALDKAAGDYDDDDDDFDFDDDEDDFDDDEDDFDFDFDDDDEDDDDVSDFSFDDDEDEEDDDDVSDFSFDDDEDDAGVSAAQQSVNQAPAQPSDQLSVSEILELIQANNDSKLIFKADDIKLLIAQCGRDNALAKAQLCDEVDYLMYPVQTNFHDCLTSTVVLFAMLMVEDFTIEDCCMALLRKELFFSAQTNDLDAIESLGFAGSEERLRVLVAATLLAKCQSDWDATMLWHCLFNKGLIDSDDLSVPVHSVKELQGIIKDLFKLAPEAFQDALYLSESLSEDVTTYQDAIATVKANQDQSNERRLNEILTQAIERS